MSDRSYKEDAMLKSIKSKIPFIFLISISLFWGIYYQGNHPLNDFGNANFEWLYLLDALIVLPVLCLILIKNKKEAALKAVVLCSLAILIGSYIIPEQNKFLMNYLEHARFGLLALIVILELSALITVYLAIKSALSQQTDPDIAIARPINKLFKQNAIANFLCFETRMWAFLFYAKHIKPSYFTGEQHFSYHKKDGSQANLLGFIFIILLELPMMHFFLHFIWSPSAANIITGLTIFSLLFFTAEYRSVARRPVSISKSQLIIRYGLYPAYNIALANIKTIDLNTGFIARARTIKRYNYSGYPNIKITLKEPQNDIDTVFLGLDNPHHFIDSTNKEQKHAI
tara:strand:+ start:19583 stop:20608 length:1026 start_codon:yes stop_codon:yes gene_type:complete